MRQSRQINRSQLHIQRLRIFIVSDGTLKTLCNWELLPLRAPALNVGTLELVNGSALRARPPDFSNRETAQKNGANHRCLQP
jgi:hypothetical protein